MNVVKWVGSLENAQVQLQELPEEARLFANQEKALILLEGNDLPEIGESYDVLDQSGDLLKGQFAVLNHIPVSDEGRTLFEERFQKRAKLIEHEPGFVAIRVLRPLQSDTYVILTIWDTASSFQQWQQSNAYEKAHAKRGTQQGIDQRPNIFPRPSFVATYTLV